MRRIWPTEGCCARRKKEASSVTVVSLPKLRQNENVGVIMLTASSLFIYTALVVNVAC